MNKYKKYKCIVCGELISMQTIGASNVIKLCWKHDVEARKFYKSRYTLDGKNVKREIISIVKESVNRSN